MAASRDDFPEKTKELLAKRSGYKCSAPECRKNTVGSATDPTKTINLGEAAHICAATENGPRYAA